MVTQRKGKTWPWVLGVIAVVFLGIWLLALHQTAHDAQAAKFHARLDYFEVLPNNYVRVTYTVTNTGKSSGTPMCEVIVQPVNAYGDAVGGGGSASPIAPWSLSPGANNFTFVDVQTPDARLVTQRSMVQVGGCTPN